MVEVVIAESALQDLEEILEYISIDSPNNATNFLNEIIQSISKLEHFKYLGRRVPSITDESVRELIFGYYRIVYILKNPRLIIVVAVHNTFRDFLPQNIK